MHDAVSELDLDGLLTPVAMLFEILGEAQVESKAETAQNWRPNFLEAFKAAGQQAQVVGIKSVSHLASLLGPFLRYSNAPQDLEIAQSLTAQLFSFLAGDLTAQESGDLFEQVSAWVQPLTPLPGAVARLLREGLAADAHLLQKVRFSRDIEAESDEELLGDIKQNELNQSLIGNELAEEVGLIGEDFDAQLSEEPRLDFATDSPEEAFLIDLPDSQAPTVALDELVMVAEAWDELGQGLAISLPAQDWDRQDDESLMNKSHLLLDVHEKLGNIANALRFMTLECSANCLEDFATGLEVFAAIPQTALGLHQNALLRWVMAWREAFTQRTTELFAAAIEELRDHAWEQADQSSVSYAASLQELSCLNVIQSRQVALRETELEDADFSLAIPSDADYNVVNQLLLEMPQLSGEFSQHIEAVNAGSLDDLGEARRIAHTLKGSANTVGIRGIAHLTHCLEDLLQLLADEFTLPSPELGEVLSMAADCLAEASEAVAGQGSTPENLPGIYTLISQEINQRVAQKNGTLASAEQLDEVAELSTSLMLSESVSEEESLAQWEPERSARGEVEAEVEVEAEAEDHALAHAQGLNPAASGVPTQTNDDEVLRVSSTLVERLIEHNTDTALLLSQAQDRVQQMDGLRRSLRFGGERLKELADELERMVDLRGLSMSGKKVQGDFDALEMDEYNELHMLSRRIAEASADARLLQQQIEQGVSGLKENIEQIDRVQVEARNTTLQIRMVPASTIVPRLQRAARQASRMVNKPVDFKVLGEQTAIEGQLLQQVVDSLGHVVRNAIDHGIEPTEQREALGKSPVGTLELSFHRVGSTVEIVCRDDGAGLDIQAIRSKAVSMGLASESDAASSSEQQIAQWIMLPGFSTKAQTTQLSGRGIGMDVVQQTVRRLRGQVSIETKSGLGTTIKIILPIRVATLPVLVTKSGGQQFAISVRGLQQLLDVGGLQTESDERFSYAFQGQLLKAHRLEQLVGLPLYALRPAAHEAISEVAMVVKLDEHRLQVVIVPELSQTRNVVVRSLPGYLPLIAGVEGAAVLGDGAIAPVLDLAELILTKDLDGGMSAFPMTESVAQTLCMIVDDSVSVRRSSEIFISDLGMDFVSAIDGVHALEVLQKRVPDIFLLDLEMPRMNGVELARAIRSDARTAKTPIIMITSRNSDKHRELAQAAGVDVFLTKPYSEDALGKHIEDCLQKASLN